jgi:hypothetical protein
VVPATYTCTNEYNFFGWIMDYVNEKNLGPGDLIPCFFSIGDMLNVLFWCLYSALYIGSAVKSFELIAG